MSKLVPILAGITGTAVIGFAGGYLISTQNTKTFKEKFNHALIKLDGKEDTLLKEKLAKLKKNNFNSDIAKLKEAKSKGDTETDNGLAELKEACKEIYNNNFTDKDSPVFKDFQSYCSKNIKDLITTNKWAPNDTRFTWNTKHAELKKPEKNLVKELATIAKKQTIENDDLKNWCQSIENLVFEGTEDITYKNASEFCTKP